MEFSTMGKLSIRDLQMNGKRVFMRVDFNVPLEGAQVADDTRIRETLPTIEFARKQGAKLVLASHLGRPKGKPDPKYSLRPAAAKLAGLIGAPVDFAADCVGPEAESKSRALANGGLLVLENVRYHAEEEANDEKFSRQLAALCDGLFVCDAFGTAHRAHASVVGITRFVKQAAAGLLMERELAYLGNALSNPERPFVAVLGGAKVSDKIEVVENLMRVADSMLIGGGMAYTFLKSQGLPIGKSLVESDKVDLARKLLAEAQQRNFQLLLPSDHVLGAQFKADTETRIASISDTPESWMGLDIGPETIAKYSAELARANTIIWNGPMGVCEMPAFAKGTLEIAHAVAAATAKGATSIVGGGDSVAAIHAAGLAEKVSHISTGGGASLEFLGGRKLPGVEALTEKAEGAEKSQAAGRMTSRQKGF
jgi:phosphoglycerate kinase